MPAVPRSCLTICGNPSSSWTYLLKSLDVGHEFHILTQNVDGIDHADDLSRSDESAYRVVCALIGGEALRRHRECRSRQFPGAYS